MQIKKNIWYLNTDLPPKCIPLLNNKQVKDIEKYQRELYVSIYKLLSILSHTPPHISISWHLFQVYSTILTVYIHDEDKIE